VALPRSLVCSLCPPPSRMAPVVAMVNVEEAQDLKRLRQTPPPTVKAAVASPLPVPTKAHVSRNVNSFDKLEEWRSNLRCATAGAGCLGAAAARCPYSGAMPDMAAAARGVQGWPADGPFRCSLVYSSKLGILIRSSTT
jgi:hypothetical protein